jgi:hypothetical protein
VQHAEPAGIATAAARTGRGMRALLAVAVVVALACGLWVRSLFRGAPVQDSVEASSVTMPAAPAPQPTWTPPALSYPPIVGYNQGVPPSMAALAIQGGPLPTSAAQPTGMTSIAPPIEPTRKTAFTDADLLRTRGQAGPVAMPVVATPVVATPVASTVTAAGAVAAAPAVPSGATMRNDDQLREWITRVRDREDDVQEAQAKVRRLEAEVDARRAHAAAVASDVEAQAKAQDDVTVALEDLEKAERKLSEKQRDLDEAKVAARAAGVRFER